MTGTLAFVGGGEWQEGCTFDAELLEASGRAEVVVLPTAAAYEHPERAVETATRWFASMGGTVRGLMVLRRPLPAAAQGSGGESLGEGSHLGTSGHR